jgi:hypothetical protein
MQEQPQGEDIAKIGCEDVRLGREAAIQNGCRPGSFQRC